nr:protein kinase-like domain-containing protein [Tanacetum cinerariifolium]
MSKEFAHLKVPLENILSATNNFTQENVIRDSGFAMEYKGQLLLSGELIDITAKRFNKERNDREQLFWVEISMLSTLKHENLVSLVGFCDENDEKIIIIKRETMGMLIEYLSDPIDRVLLNDGWEPKLCDFVWSMKIKASQRHRSFYTPFKSVNGYADPTYLETNRVSHKSDMYSFGIVLFELLCGRKSIIDDKDDNHLAMLAITHYREKKLDNIIDTDLWKQIDLHSFNMFAEIAYECLDEERSRCPNIDDIVPRLEKALESARENKPVSMNFHRIELIRYTRI